MIAKPEHEELTTVLRAALAEIAEHPGHSSSSLAFSMLSRGALVSSSGRRWKAQGAGRIGGSLAHQLQHRGLVWFHYFRSSHKSGWWTTPAGDEALAGLRSFPQGAPTE